MLALLASWNVVEFTVYRGVGTAFFLTGISGNYRVLNWGVGTPFFGKFHFQVTTW